MSGPGVSQTWQCSMLLCNTCFLNFDTTELKLQRLLQNLMAFSQVVTDIGVLIASLDNMNWRKKLWTTDIIYYYYYTWCIKSAIILIALLYRWNYSIHGLRKNRRQRTCCLAYETCVNFDKQIRLFATLIMTPVGKPRVSGFGTTESMCSRWILRGVLLTLSVEGLWRNLKH